MHVCCSELLFRSCQKSGRVWSLSRLFVSLCFMQVLLLGPNSAYESSQDYYDQYQEEEEGEVKGQASSELEDQLRSASSVTELMDIFYPEYRKIHECLQRRVHVVQRAMSEAEEKEWKEAAAFTLSWQDEDIKNVELEWEKTQCKPREVCLDVGKELGTATNKFYKPPCVSIHRCGGCCNREGLQCVNISTSYVSKTLFEITLPRVGFSKLVMISFINHTACTCQTKRDTFGQSHSIIRRSFHISQTGCIMENKTCPHGLTWNPQSCRCVTELEDFSFEASNSEPADDGGSEMDDFCGPNMVFDEDTCSCVCTNRLSVSSCGPNKEFDESTCKCVCSNIEHHGVCEPPKEWDEEACECVCNKNCPKNQPLNSSKCTCECTESVHSCFRKGKKFDSQTCRCYRLPCRTQVKHCQSGFYFSYYVCSCLPLYMKEYQIDE
ncbi:vascular endothelial growth factor C-like isoform X1 [Chiloscyllium punctatum]|uniref:vascular endothelial growth factor C-like isoform X1 n=1 Tax=Chiloscyllium punctatum TaxID=137246 RepID=UPI003B635E03